MKIKRNKLFIHIGNLFILSTVFFAWNSLHAWGFLGHKTINKNAVFALPPEMFGFYKKHIDFLTTHAVDADNRRYLFSEEACRHYLDCEQYEFAAPMDTVPHYWKKAVEKYGEDSLLKHGIVPWHCLFMLYRLTTAFEEHDLQKILRTSADIGHYIGDAHVPLHASRNYNGQFTGQDGIHALWESRIPQLFLDSFDLLTGTASYLDNPTEFIWNAIGESYALKDSVLMMEKLATNRNEANKYSMEQSGRNVFSTYSPQFCKDYNNLMQGMVERRMRAAINAVAAFWYTAWVNAGMPDLSKIDGETKVEQEDEDAQKAKENGKIKGREEYEK